MKWLQTLLARMAENAQRREQQRYEAYLSGATDLYELEYLQRSWDRNSAEQQRGYSFR